MTQFLCDANKNVVHKYSETYPECFEDFLLQEKKSYLRTSSGKWLGIKIVASIHIPPKSDKSETLNISAS